MSSSFLQCSNLNCSSIFIADEECLKDEFGMLCPKCRLITKYQHVVQCDTCNSVIKFLPLEPIDEPVVYHVKRCSKCSGTWEDELMIESSEFPDAFV